MSVPGSSDVEDALKASAAAVPELPEAVTPAGPDGAPAPPALVADASPGLSRAWRALRHRNFRLFFSGQSISLIGTWMTRIATSWLVYRLTGSALLLGVVGFVGADPDVPAGSVCRRMGRTRLNRRNVLVWTQVLAAVQSLVLAALTLAHVVTMTEIIILSVFQGPDQRVRYARGGRHS